MFQAKIENKDLTEIVNLIMTLVSEAKFEANADGMSVKAVDAAHVAMLIIELERDAYLEYNSDNEELCVDLNKMKDVLKLGSSGEMIEIEKEGSKLKFTLGNLVRSMGLIDPSALNVPKIPNLSLPAKVVISIEDFKGGIKSAGDISDTVVFKLSPKEFEIYAEGDTDLSSMFLPMDMVKEISCDEEVKSSYPVDYLSKLVKSMSSVDELTLYLGEDYPMKLEFSVARGKGKATFLLAPRIES